MKYTTLLAALFVLGATSAPAADPPPTPPAQTPAPTNAPAPAAQDKSTDQAKTTSATNAESLAAASAAAPDSQASGTNAPTEVAEQPLEPGMLRLNFRGVALDMVLDYLSEAAGFIINLQASPRGRVDVWSNTPVTKDEALDILDSVLKKNGLAAIRNGRTLTIVNRDEAKIHDIPVKLGSDPGKIPRNDEIVTQILPVRFVEAGQLVKDLQPLVSVQTTMTANEAGNSIVVTDSQSNIRRIAEIIQAIDMGAEDVTEVKVFRLQNSDPTEISDLLVSLFPDETRSGSGGSSSPVQFGFSRFFSRGGFGGPPGGSSSSSGQNQRIRKRARVLAVPDPRTSSVVVSASKDLMAQIEGVVLELDASNARKQTVHTYQLQNADPQEVQEVLQEMFERNNTSSRSTQNRNDSTLRNRRTTQGTTGSSSGNRSSRTGLQSNGTIGR